jgi:hypothetical protein
VLELEEVSNGIRAYASTSIHGELDGTIGKIKSTKLHKTLEFIEDR